MIGILIVVVVGIIWIFVNCRIVFGIAGSYQID